MLVTDIVERKEDSTFSLIWMKHVNGFWYVSTGNPRRVRCLYSEDETTARINFFNGQIGREQFLATTDELRIS